MKASPRSFQHRSKALLAFISATNTSLYIIHGGSTTSHSTKDASISLEVEHLTSWRLGTVIQYMLSNGAQSRLCEIHGSCRVCGIEESGHQR